MLEVRLDQAPLPPSELERLVASSRTILATCRPTEVMTEAQREALLDEAISAGVALVDIEFEAAFRGRILARARSAGCRCLLSFHDFAGTPSRERLEELIRQGLAEGADLVKLACWVDGPTDAARLLGLMDPPRPLVLAGMGPFGRIVRLAAPLLGCPFTFAAPDGGEGTAPGQMSVAETARLLARLRGSKGAS